MKKVKKYVFKVSLFFIIFFLFLNTNQTFADEEDLTGDILTEQKASLDISGFLEKAKKYTVDTFKDTNYTEILNSALVRKYR